MIEKCWIVLARLPVAAPLPADRVERVGDGIGPHDHAGASVAAVDEGGGGRRQDAVTHHVGVLYRVDVDGGAEGVERQRVGPGHGAEVEPGAVVGRHRAIVVATVGVDADHALDGKARPVDALERARDIVGHGRGHHQLAVVIGAVEAEVAKADQGQLAGVGAARVGVPRHPAELVGDGGGERLDPGPVSAHGPAPGARRGPWGRWPTGWSPGWPGRARWWWRACMA